MSAAMGERSIFAAPRVGKLAGVVYDSLKAQIHDFQLVAGDRFSEAELAQRLGVSRTPVREALFRLRDEGFLGIESKLGWYVLPIDFGRLEQLYDLRVILELASIARLCARADAPTELEALKAIRLGRRPSDSPIRAASVCTTSSSTRRSSALLATMRWRVSTGT